MHKFVSGLEMAGCHAERVYTLECAEIESMKSRALADKVAFAEFVQSAPYGTV